MNKTNKIIINKTIKNKMILYKFKGFSLIEVVVFIAIIALCILALASVYYSIVKNQNKAMYNDLIRKKTQTFFNLYIENKRQIYLKGTYEDLNSKIETYANYLLAKINNDPDLNDIEIEKIHTNLIKEGTDYLAGIYSESNDIRITKYYLKLTIKYKIKRNNMINQIETLLPVFVESKTPTIVSQYAEITIDYSTATTTTVPGGGGAGGGGGTPSGGGGGCFELSSLVLTKENNNYKLKKMGDVKVGDIVL
ncbi:MAG: type IV pilus modification PilV family protein, partial [bacterium]